MIVENEVMYICDRKKCEVCHEYCGYTSDIRHAENFKEISPGVFEENKTGLYVFKSQMHIREKDLQHIRESIIKQIEDGVVVLPPWMDVAYIPENSAVKFESEDDDAKKGE